MELAIGQSRAMRQEIAERDRACGLVCLIQRSLRIAQHARVREFGRTSRDRFVEVKASFIEHRQRRDGGHGLAHRRDAEDGVALDGQSGNQVALPYRRDVDHLAIAPDQSSGPGEFAKFRIGCEEVLDRSVVCHRSSILFSPARGKPKGDKRDRTRASLLEAARELIREKGAPTR
jgi:hypothetical protein